MGGLKNMSSMKSLSKATMLEKSINESVYNVEDEFPDKNYPPLRKIKKKTVKIKELSSESDEEEDKNKSKNAISDFDLI